MKKRVATAYFFLCQIVKSSRELMQGQTMSEQVSERPLIDHKYGIRSPVKIPDLELELYAFRNRFQPNEGGLGTFDHFRNATKLMWPKMSWNPWLEDQSRRPMRSRLRRMGRMRGKRKDFRCDPLCHCLVVSEPIQDHRCSHVYNGKDDPEAYVGQSSGSWFGNHADSPATWSIPR